MTWNCKSGEALTGTAIRSRACSRSPPPGIFPGRIRHSTKKQRRKPKSLLRLPGSFQGRDAERH